MAQMYNNPPDQKSSIDGPGSDQMHKFYWWKKAIIQAEKDQYFMPLADVAKMPANYGKTIKVYEYVPLLDDRNENSQGIDANGAVIADGNLYGSSKDIGTIEGKLPFLNESGGRVNRVGFTRLTREGSIKNFGIFTEFTKDSFDFDSDPDVYGHISREMVTGATQLTEAVLQKDLLSGPGVIVYAGAATADSEITAEGATPSVVDYDDLMRTNRILTDNRTPMQTTMIKGSSMTDTRTISRGRICFIGSELESTVRRFVDDHGNAAFVPTHKYADGGEILRGEIGSIEHFRFVVVPEMLHWAGAGANVGTNPGYESSGGKYNVYPMLIVGDGAFTAIGFQMKKVFKFEIITKMPGRETADRTDPYGKMGFSSIQWWYGMMWLRPERCALVKTVARR